MSSLRDELIVKISAVLLIILITIGSYYFFTKDNKLAEAKTKVKVETQKLDNLKDTYTKEREVIKDIKEQYNLLKNGVVRNTDIFFKDAGSNNPKILIKLSNKDQEKNINNKRLEITKLLEAWDKKIEDLESNKSSVESITTLSELVNQIKKDVRYVKQYVEELKDIVSEVTPDYSGISQNQIVTYELILGNTLEQIQQIDSNIQTVENYVPQIYAPSNAPQNATTTSGTVNNNQNTNTQTTPPITTTTQIQNQEQVITEAQAEQNQIEVGVASTTPQPTPTPPEEPNLDSIPYYVYYPTSYYSGIGAQTLMEYLQSLPAPVIDRSGWPDISNEDTGKPLISN